MVYSSLVLSPLENLVAHSRRWIIKVLLRSGLKGVNHMWSLDFLNAKLWCTAHLSTASTAPIQIIYDASLINQHHSSTSSSNFSNSQAESLSVKAFWGQHRSSCSPTPTITHYSVQSNGAPKVTTVISVMSPMNRNTKTTKRAFYLSENLLPGWTKLICIIQNLWIYLIESDSVIFRVAAIWGQAIKQSYTARHKELKNKEYKAQYR